MSNRGYLFDCTRDEVYLNNNKYATHQNHCVVIRTKQNLIERYGLKGLLKLCESLPEKHGKSIEIQEHWTSDDLADAMWKLFKEITDGQIRDERRAKKEARAKTTGESRELSSQRTMPKRYRWPRVYKICREAIGEILRPGQRSSIPHQARAIIAAAWQQPLDLLTEEQMKELIIREVEEGRLETKQNPWRIFLYYENMLHQHSLILRIIKREK